MAFQKPCKIKAVIVCCCIHMNGNKDQERQENGINNFPRACVHVGTIWTYLTTT